MPLRSLMLKDDPSLQACLVQDQSHVVPGAKGNHVAKIQKALLLLEQAGIQSGELRSRLYGPTTVAAVLAYKRKRRIINPAYQTTPDNIVGKMTIARLDTDLLEIEQRVTPNRVVCGGSGGGSASGGPVAGITERVVRRLNASLSILFQETTAAEQSGGSLLLVQQLVARARELMAPHGIDFTGGPFPEFGPTVPDFEQVIPGSPASCFSVRETAENVLPGRAQALRVIFCPFDDKGEAFGVTDGGDLAGRSFPKFCLINVKKRNPDLGTLLHEMIHAAKAIKIGHDGDPRSVFSEEQARTFLPAQHAESVANAFFSVRRL
jgi:hypothetical protein